LIVDLASVDVVIELFITKSMPIYCYMV